MAKIGFSSIAVMACAVGALAADGTFVDFASAGPQYSISTGQFAKPEDAARQMSVGPDGLTVLFDTAREGKPYRWATISVPRVVGGGRDWSTLRIRLLLAGKPTGKAKRDIALNLTDAHGETFQYYPCGFSEDADGNLCLEYDFAGKHGHGWGGDGNHQMDLPARLSALNVHFGGEGTGRVTFRRIESAEDACGAARTVVSCEPISTDTTYPGARPFNGPRILTFEVKPAVSGTARLTLSSGSAGNAWQGRMDGFDGVVSNGVARFDLNLPYGRRYQFMKLQVKGETIRPVRAVGEFLQTEAEAMRLDVDTGNPLHLVRDGKEKPVLVVRNPAERAVSWRTAFVFRDVFGRRFEIPFARKMAAGEEVRVEVPGPLPAKGLWRVAANVTGGDGSRAFKETRFAFIDRHERTPIVEKPKFRFGIHYHGTHYWPHLLDLTVEALVAAGAKFTRCDYDHMWSDIERTPGVYDWTKSDAMIERLRNAGLALDIIMLSMPSWAIDETARAKAPDQRKRGLRVRYLPIKPGTFRAFAEVYARRYGTKIDYYEIGNEIDLTGTETLPHETALAIQREAYEGLHAGCSNVCVTTCGWAGAYTSPDATPNTYNVGIQEAFAEHPELYDVWAQHVHGPFARFANVLDGGFAKLRERTPLKTRPWISNETALTSAFGEENAVARNVWMKPLFAWSRGARDYIWYNLRATGWFDGSEPGYGLITPDFHPRAGYAAFAALTTVFQGLDYDGAVYSRGLRHLLRFRGTSQAMPDGLVLAGWDDKLAADDSWTVRIATDATRAELCDHMGNRTPAQIDGGTVTFPISRNPQALLLFGASKAEAAEPLPKVWMSAQWRDPFSETIRLCAEQGVDVVEVPSWTTNHCAYVLAALRKYKVKGFTSSGTDPSKNVPPDAVEGKTVERAVFTGGAYRGKAIDRTLFTFEPKAYDIVIEPPVYSARQGYTSKKKGPDGKMRTVRSGHYFGAFVPTGEAEIIVPEKLFDGEPHVRIIPCKVLPVEDGRKPENDTVTDKMSGPEIENRRLVRLVFDLSDCKGLMLDKVGIAVYWASDTESDGWKQRRRGQLSVFSEHTRRAARENGARRANQWVLVNGGTFPKDDIIAIRFGDECFNLTGWVDCPAASFPLWGFSPSGRAAFAREGRRVEDAAPYRSLLIQPRTWGYPEIYGAEAYGIALYSYHKACAELTRAFAEGVRSVAPSLKVFRNTTRGDAWSEGNDHDGSGQELLARELDFIHLDPYPVGGRYNSQTIPFDMGYLSGLARRYHKPLVPWMQAHSYAPSGLGNITPADMKRMWEQHAPFAPDAMMWLGFDMKPGKTDTEMTFPKGSPESWAYAKELFAEVHAQAVAQERDPPAGRAGRPRPAAQLAVIRPYSTRAICCAQGPAWAAWRNPADRILEAYVRAWSVDNGLLYDIFELPPTGGAQFIAPELKKYKYIVSTVPYPGARVLGEGTEGKVMTAKEIAASRKKFAAEIAALIASPNGK